MPSITRVDPEAGVVEFAIVELHTDDGEHDNGKEEQEANLQQRNHGFHYGLQHHLQTCGREEVERETQEQYRPQ